MSITPEMSPALAVFCREYQQLSGERLSVLREIYAPDIHFQDPAHQIQGIEALVEYFDGLFSNVTQCQFEITQVMEQAPAAFIRWTMTFAHPQLNGGKTVSIPGVSYLEFAEQVTVHRDYFDLGAMIYEQVPVLGALVKILKRRLSQ
ncbi:MAG: nuclear transport factor 2 family protein [Oceanisphaera sp.]|uniref:nuclear transport factor 2 family protein n=1 Tax=Oceanisphaera sp. TaxID=1929979 RepID=UPI003F98B078